MSLSIKVEFAGGLETLFNNQKTLRLKLDGPDAPKTIGGLVTLLAEKELGGNKDLFIMKGKVRPGILVLINDADWELEGEEAYELQDGDTILFVSTLHGG